MTQLPINVTTNWKNIISEILNKNEKTAKNLEVFLDNEHTNFYGIAEIFPPKHLIFNAFSFFNFEDLKVVIVGQDPYHQKGQAMGLSFSVNSDCKIPPSLKNIFKEIQNNFGAIDSGSINCGDLTYLAEQGVLLLNRSLTVRESAPNSHRKYWKFFTDELLKYIVRHSKNKIFLLWGNDAKSIKKEFEKNNIDISNHYFLESTHPSPLGANKGGWFGTNNFKKANNILESLEAEPINWLPN